MLELFVGLLAGVFVPDRYKAPIRIFIRKGYDKVHEVVMPPKKVEPSAVVQPGRPANPLLEKLYLESSSENPVDPATVTDEQISEYLEHMGVMRTALNIENHRKDMALAWAQANTESVP